ncbi:MAG: endopeptidase La [Firmicutes bacterium]|nr:endopeptidase La [Bacillota bacterium]
MIELDKSNRDYLADESLPLLPLRDLIIFPFMVYPFPVGRDKSISALEEAMLKDRLIILAAQRQGKVSDPNQEDIYTTGTLAEIKQMLKLPDGTIKVLVEGLRRVRVVQYLQSEPHYRVRWEEVFEPAEPRDVETEALIRSTLYHFEQFIKLSKKIPSEVLVSINNIDDPGKLADIIASHLDFKVDDKQKILEAVSVKLRLETLCSFLMKEIDILEMERKIHFRVRKQMEKTQKEYYLREQMKAIQKELGDHDERMAEVEELRARLAKLTLPEEVEEKTLKEIDRLAKMPPMTAEAVVVRNYIDWLLSLPWDKVTEDRLDVMMAEQILNEDHYGLEKVKERILEYLAVCQLTKQLKGPLLCLIGPPGVGKTSLAKSVARALNRKFVRFSLGGVRDEAEIRGHRRTYVGAMPGKIIQILKQAGSKNPVILLDEVDKMSTDFRGDPSSALLEVLDPEQNCNFGDHYLEVAFDLSKVFFITTANTYQGIPRPLLDRMEVINISGYTEEEKLEIAKRHLLPKQTTEHGMTNEDLIVPDPVIRQIISCYTRESGVRNLERQLAAVCRKAAREIIQTSKRPVRVSKGNLQKFLGIPKYRHNLAEEEDQVGLATGLAWTEVGGDILSIEVTLVKGKGQLILTGKLGEVMRESAQAAFSYIRSRARELGIQEDFHEKYDLHIHIPEGAIPKDGPSAGITIATAIVSALTNRPVRKDVAMTGEITLRGRVLPIGGLKEKILAAHRGGIKNVLVPRENQKDLEEIPLNIARKVNIELVESMDEVWREALVAPSQPEKVGPAAVN